MKKRLKKISTSPIKKIVNPGDIVISNFDNEFMLTFLRPHQHEDRITKDVRFHKKDIGLVAEIILTPESFYSVGFANVILPEGAGWVPFGWVEVINS